MRFGSSWSQGGGEGGYGEEQKVAAVCSMDTIRVNTIHFGEYVQLLKAEKFELCLVGV